MSDEDLDVVLILCVKFHGGCFFSPPKLLERERDKGDPIPGGVICML